MVGEQGGRQDAMLSVASRLWKRLNAPSMGSPRCVGEPISPPALTHRLSGCSCLPCERSVSSQAWLGWELILGLRAWFHNPSGRLSRRQ